MCTQKVGAAKWSEFKSAEQGEIEREQGCRASWAAAVGKLFHEVVGVRSGCLAGP